MSAIKELPDISVDTDTSTKLIPPYHVVIKNDDFHTMSFVVLVLMEVFGYDKMLSFKLMALIHQEGRAIVWTGSKEVAELKLEQILARREESFGPLDAHIEAA